MSEDSNVRFSAYLMVFLMLLVFFAVLLPNIIDDLGANNKKIDDCNVCVNDCFHSYEKQQFIATITNTTKGVTKICRSYCEVCS